MAYKSLFVSAVVWLAFGQPLTPAPRPEPPLLEARHISSRLLAFAIPGTYFDPDVIETMVSIRKQLEIREGPKCPPLLFSVHHSSDSIDLVFQDPELDARSGRVLWILAWMEAQDLLTYDLEETKEGNFLTVTPLRQMLQSTN